MPKNEIKIDLRFKMNNPEFRYLKNHFRRKRQKEDEFILEKILMELKEKHAQEKKQKIELLQEQLKKIKG